MRREDVIQYLIDENKFTRYLEIGVEKGNNFSKIRCESKVGVDPKTECSHGAEYKSETLLQMTSDEFFERNLSKFDIVFIDGLHLYEQVIRDIVNSINCLNIGGYIVIHDCKPWNGTCGREPSSPGSAWNGDVFRSIIWFREIHPKYPCFVLDCDWGLGIIHNDRDRGQMDHWATIGKYMEYGYGWLSTHWKEYGLVEPEYLYQYAEKTYEQVHE
jgi:hypothetical protein